MEFKYLLYRLVYYCAAIQMEQAEQSRSQMAAKELTCRADLHGDED